MRPQQQLVISLSILKACCDQISVTHGRHNALSELGVNSDDFAVLTGEDFWTQDKRVSVSRCMQALRDGMAAVQGFQPVQVPAEYQAALICYFVHRVNWRAACAWLAGVSVPADHLAAGVSGSSEVVTDRQLFSMVLAAAGDCKTFATIHNSRMNKQAQVAERKNAA